MIIIKWKKKVYWLAHLKPKHRLFFITTAAFSSSAAQHTTFFKLEKTSVILGSAVQISLNNGTQIFTSINFEQNRLDRDIHSWKTTVSYTDGISFPTASEV